MKINQAVLDIVSECVDAHPGSIPMAVSIAVSMVREHPSYKDLVETLVTDCIQGLVYQKRQAINKEMKKSAGEYGGRPRVQVGTSEAVRRVSRSLYEYRIGGLTLGSLTREALERVASNERAMADGHNKNARLCEKLLPMMPGVGSVMDQVSERKLEKVWQEVFGLDGVA